MLYMDIRETGLKCSIDALIICLLYFVFSVNLFIGFAIIHTFNMFFNGHFFAMRRHMGLGENDPRRFITYIEKLRNRIRLKPYVAAAAAYGSLSKNIYRPTSDIDIRIVPGERCLDFFQTCLFALSERSRAFLSGFPLDLYVFDAKTLQKKMDSRETPIVFYDSGRIFAEIYLERVRAEEFFQAFRTTHVNKK